MSSSDRKLVARQMLERRMRTAAMLKGAARGSTADRLRGYPPMNGDEHTDRLAFFANQAAHARNANLEPELALFERARDAVDPAPLWELINSLPHPAPVRDRTLVYLALEFCERQAQEILGRIIRSELNASTSVSMIDCVYSLALAAVLDTYPRQGDIKDLGRRIEMAIGYISEDAADILAVKAALDAPPIEPPAGNKALSPLNALTRLAHKLDESERNRTVVPANPDVSPTGRSLIVIPALGEPTGSSARKDVITQFKAIAGLPLPFVGNDDLADVLSRLLKRSPHFAAEIDLILRQAQPFRLLLVGSPGCGKTSLARDLADVLGLASVVYPAGGSSDSSFAGTSAQWSTARASTPIQLILRARQANPVVILDELEKSGTSRHNGAFVDSALSFLEPSSARRVLDPALEVECDLSAVSYVATANSLDGVPVALLDRLRAIQMPDPRLEHLPALVRTMFDDIAHERAIDRRWLQPLAADELQLLQKAWPGGSLRRLRRVIEIVLDGREQHMGRA